MRIDHYDWSGGREAMLRFGPDALDYRGPVAVVALPLFEEANRVRAFAVTICRALAKRGVASALPDLPGQGESLVPLATLTCVSVISDAYDAAVASIRRPGDRIYGVAIRSGALLNFSANLDGRWRLAPQGGHELLRDLTRIKQAAVGNVKPLPEFWYQEPLAATGQSQPPAEVAGNHIAARFFTMLKADVIHDATDNGSWRTIRLDTDPKPADRHVPGPPPWRRVEPDNDPALAALLADDIADWIAACER